jgi:hypothetical protein
MVKDNGDNLTAHRRVSFVFTADQHTCFRADSRVGPHLCRRNP